MLKKRANARRYSVIALMAAAILCVIPGCDAGEEPIDVVYDCGEISLRVTFGEDLALVRTGEEEHTLPIAISASGARYSNGVVEFWEHQGTARFTTPTAEYDACRPVVVE